MNAWQRLLAASSLVIGTAWEHLTHQIAGSTGNAVIVNDGISIAINVQPIFAVMDITQLDVLLDTTPIVVMVASDPISIVFTPPAINTQVSI